MILFFLESHISVKEDIIHSQWNCSLMLFYLLYLILFFAGYNWATWKIKMASLGRMNTMLDSQIAWELPTAKETVDEATKCTSNTSRIYKVKIEINH